MIKGSESAMSHERGEGKGLLDLKSQMLLREAKEQCHYLQITGS